MRSLFKQEHGNDVAASRVRRVLWRLLGCVATLAVAPQALAAPLTCDATFHQIRREGGTITHVSVVDRTTAPYTLTTRYTLSPALNGLGYNPSDNYLYAIGSNNPRGLYRLGDAGAELSNVTISGIRTASTLDAGTFDNAGNFFVAYNDGVIQRIDGITGAAPSPSALTVPKQQDPAPPSGWTGTANGDLLVGDWAYNPAESNAGTAVIYGTRSAEGGSIYLYRVRIVDPSGPSPEAYVSRRTIPGMTVANAVGTMFMDSTGMLYTYDNGSTASAGFTRIDPVAGTVTAVSGAQGANQSDGANCPLATALVEPTIVLNKITVDGIGGPFAFTLTNTGQATGTATTATVDTAVQVDGNTGTAGTQPFTVSAFNTAVTIAESTLPEGWALTSAACTVAGGAGGAGTPVGSFNAATRTYTIPAGNVVSGAQFTCTFTNTRQAVIRLQKAFAAGGRVADTDQVVLSVAPAGGTAATGTTTGTGAAVTSTQIVLNPAMTGVVHTLSESASDTFLQANYATTYACTNAAGGVGPSGTAASFDVTPAAGDDLTCVFTNTPLVTDLQIVKTVDSPTANVGDTVVYTLTVTNAGPGDANNATVQDPAVTGLSCTAAPICTVPAGSAAACPTAPLSITELQGTGIAIPVLPQDSSVELSLSCVVE